MLCGHYGERLRDAIGWATKLCTLSSGEGDSGTGETLNGSLQTGRVNHILPACLPAQEAGRRTPVMGRGPFSIRACREWDPDIHLCTFIPLRR